MLTRESQKLKSIGFNSNPQLFSFESMFGLVFLCSSFFSSLFLSYFFFFATRFGDGRVVTCFFFPGVFIGSWETTVLCYDPVKKKGHRGLLSPVHSTQQLTPYRLPNDTLSSFPSVPLTELPRVPQNPLRLLCTLSLVLTTPAYQPPSQPISSCSYTALDYSLSEY